MLSQYAYGGAMIAPSAVDRPPSAIMGRPISAVDGPGGGLGAPADAVPSQGKLIIGPAASAPADCGAMDKVEVNGQGEVQLDATSQACLSVLK